MFNNVLLRWSLGSQNTVSLSDYEETEKYKDYLWLAKLSIRSFQNWFPGARFVLLYNGHEFSRFVELWKSIDVDLLYDVEMIDQCSRMKIGVYRNPYHFAPIGVWWKWIPFRFDLSRHEIAVDTDIICINRPQSWYDWIAGDTSIVVAPERFEKIQVNTCGDLYKHPILREKKPANCGIVGQRSGENYADRFFNATKEVRLGHTHDSMFITEQGTINLWIYSLALENIRHTILDFRRNAWIRDFVYFLRSGCSVETIHAVSWHKEIVKAMRDVFQSKVCSELSDDDFLSGVLDYGSRLDGLHKLAIFQQLKPDFGPVEYYLVRQ